jgi:hypothetical protein
MAIPEVTRSTGITPHCQSPARAILRLDNPAEGAELQADLLRWRRKNCNSATGKQRGSAVVHWVVQRNGQTGVLITFRSFSDYADAERHKAELEAIADPLGRTNVVAIESLPFGEFPKVQNKRGGFS